MKKLGQTLTRMSTREKVMVGLAVLAVTITFSYLVVSSIQQNIAETERLITVRSTQYENLQQLVKRYSTLNKRLERAQQTFAASQMTFEQVTEKLDGIVQASIGSTNYDLKRGRSLEQIGLEYEKQDFTLRVSSISLAQTVKLLHGLENSDSPLFLGKVDLLKSAADHTFNATLEIYSIRKS